MNISFRCSLSFKSIFCAQQITNKLFHNSFTQTTFKQSKILNKLLNKGGRKKVHFTPVEYSSPNFNAATKTKDNYKINLCKIRRAEQVSKVLFSYISDLIQYGDEDFPKIEETIEILKVKIYPDFSALVVYWVATGTKKDDDIQKMLMKNSNKIRQHLINLHFVNTLPPITFVPDLSEVQYQIVVDLLKTADMGPESDQLSGEDLLKQQPHILPQFINGSLEKQIKECLYNIKTNLLSDKNTKEIYKDFEQVSGKVDPNLLQVDSHLEVLNQFENDVYQLDHTYLIQLVKEKESDIKKNLIKIDGMFLPNQNFTEKCFKVMTKRKANASNLKEYTYDQYLREKNEINHE